MPGFVVDLEDVTYAKERGKKVNCLFHTSGTKWTDVS